MKTKRFVLLAVMSLLVAFTAKAETKALIVNTENTTETLEIKEGQVATVLFWGFSSIGDSSESDRGNLHITIAGKTITYSRNSFTFFSYNGGRRHFFQAPSFTPVVPGPATIQLKYNNSDSMITVKIENDSGAGDSNSVTVIPDSTEDAMLVLEGSDDMVNWTVETLGDKPKVNRKKFYRLRAVKN